MEFGELPVQFGVTDAEGNPVTDREAVVGALRTRYGVGALPMSAESIDDGVWTLPVSAEDDATLVEEGLLEFEAGGLTFTAELP